MVAMGEQLGVPYGLSDHTPGVWTSVAAVALGAVVVEKHFTLSKRLYGPDHHASLTPEELARLVEGVREVEAAMGDGRKERDPSLDPGPRHVREEHRRQDPDPAGRGARAPRC